MKTVAVTLEEGGPWVEPYEEMTPVRDHPGFHPKKGILVHSIKFEDGSVWDAVNGFRRD
jgi:hypothetical protein